MYESEVLASDLWQSLEESDKKLKIAIEALENIAMWTQGLQDELEKANGGISMWRGCIAVASLALEKIYK